MIDLTVTQVRSFLLNYFAPAMRAARLQPGDIGEDFDLLQAGLLDSLGILELLNAIEQRFRVRVDFEPVDPAQLMRFGFLATYLVEHAHATQIPAWTPPAPSVPAAPIGAAPLSDRLSLCLFSGLSVVIDSGAAVVEKISDLMMV